MNETLLAEEEPDPARWAQLKLSLKEKLSTMTPLDSKILDLTEDERLQDEILESDEFKDAVYRAIVNLDRTATAAVLVSTAPTTVTAPTAIPITTAPTTTFS